MLVNTLGFTSHALYNKKKKSDEPTWFGGNQK